MKLEEIRKIAEQRTKGKWETPPVEKWRVQENKELGAKDFHTICECSAKAPYSYGMTSNCNNARFIALAANTYDVLLDIVEAMKNCRALYPNADHDNQSTIYEINIVRDALKKLESL